MPQVQAHLSLLLPRQREQVQPHAALLLTNIEPLHAIAQHNATQSCCVCAAKSAAQHILAQLQGVWQGVWQDVSNLTLQAQMLTAEHMRCAAAQHPDFKLYTVPQLQAAALGGSRHDC